MKFKGLLVTLGLSLAVGVGVGVGLNANKPVEVKAEAASGTITLDLTKNWASAACNVSVYFFDAESHNGWGSYESVAKDQYEAEVTYSFDWTPTKMIAVRYSNSFTEDAWKANRWAADTDYKWNQAPSSDGYAYANHLRITDWATATTDYAYVASSEESWGKKLDLTGVKLNGSKHCEYYYDEISLKKDEKFKVVYAGEWYGSYNLADVIDEKDFGTSDGNIKCNKAGTYAFYFDASSHSVHITDPVLAAADDWAQNFLGAGCTATKAGWATSGTSYAALPSGSRALFLAEAHVDHEEVVSGYVKQAVQRYDYVLELYGTSTYADFMGRVDAGKVTPKAANNVLGGLESNNNTAAIMVVTFSSLAALALGGFFFVRSKRKSDR